MKESETIYKQVGETPLEALERYRATQIAAGHTELTSVPMTYAGRLDPMAEGKLLILIGEECKNKERWLGLDKEYEVEIVFGIETDTHDALGMADRVVTERTENAPDISPMLERYIGRFTQEYPEYSSKMFSWKGDEPPTKDVEIYSISLLEQGNIAGVELKTRIFSMIDKVKGDFRQKEIKRCWDELLQTEQRFPTIKIRVNCSSGTYMRSLAQRIGKDAGVGAFALAIKRTKILD